MHTLCIHTVCEVIVLTKKHIMLFLTGKANGSIYFSLITIDIYTLVSKSFKNIILKKNHSFKEEISHNRLI